MVLELEDFILSNNLLPIGTLVFVFFCTRSSGWGWNNFIKEADTGAGFKFPKRFKPYMRCILPLIILVVLIKSWMDIF